jgi:hypothetical protein
VDIIKKLKALLSSQKKHSPRAPVIPSWENIKNQFKQLEKKAKNTPLLTLPSSKEVDLYNIEYQITILELSKLFDELPVYSYNMSTQEYLKIKNFLANRWERIRKGFVIYPVTFSLPLTQLCEQLAFYIFPHFENELPGAANQKCHYQLLMPSLMQLEDPVSGVLLKDLPLHTFLVSETGTDFFVIEDILNYWFNASDQMHPYRLNPQTITLLPLTEHETKSLEFHTLETKMCALAIEEYHRNRNIFSAAKALRILVAGLRAHSIRIGGMGTDYQAGVGVYRYINFFKAFLEKIPAEAKTAILAARATEYAFASYWNTLTMAENLQNTQNQIRPEALAQTLTVDRCVNEISDKIENIIDANPWLENTLPPLGIESSLVGFIQQDIATHAYFRNNDLAPQFRTPH